MLGSPSLLSQEPLFAATFCGHYLLLDFPPQKHTKAMLALRKHRISFQEKKAPKKRSYLHTERH